VARESLAQLETQVVRRPRQVPEDAS
jgi:hypothetical protein